MKSYAIPKYKFRLFFVTYDRDLDVIHYLKYEKRKNWLQPENSGIPIIDRCFITLDEVEPSEFEKYYMYEFRQQIIRQGFLTLIDFIFVPAILIIFLTYYRFQNISKEMKHNFGWKTKRLVLENCERDFHI